MEKDEHISRVEYEALKAENAELNQKLDYFMGQLRCKFGEAVKSPSKKD